MTYRTPLQDIDFLLHHVLKVQDQEIPGYADLDPGFTSAILGEAAKLLGIPEHGRNNLIKFLRRDGILMANNVAMQRFIDRGYFCVVQQDYFAADSSPQVRPVTRVFASGVEFIRSRMENYIKRQLAKPGKK